MSEPERPEPSFEPPQVVRRRSAPDAVGLVVGTRWSEQAEEWLYRIQFGVGIREVAAHDLEHLPTEVGTWDDFEAGNFAGAPAFKRLLTYERLRKPPTRIGGILDLVALDGESDIVVVDFKTGAARDSHTDQLLLYAMLWWRATGEAPRRIEVQYLDDGWTESVTTTALERAEEKVRQEISTAVNALERQPGPTRASSECARCPVRARCEERWVHAEDGTALSARTTDCEVTVVSAPTPTGFTGRRRDQRELAVVYDAAVGHTLPAMSISTRLRLVDAVPVEEALEIRAWLECGLL